MSERLTEWLPIETAPKDGTMVWLNDPAGTRTYRRIVDEAGNFRGLEPDGFKPYQQVGWYDGTRWEMVDEQTGGCGGAEPDLWYPLPLPPHKALAPGR